MTERSLYSPAADSIQISDDFDGQHQTELHEAMLNPVCGQGFERQQESLLHEVLLNPSWDKTGKKILKTSTGNWNVNELLDRRTLFWEETLKTSISKGTTSARNWNVNDKHHVRWHFHQLECVICVAARAARGGRDGQEILGTKKTCSGIAASKRMSTYSSWSTICGSSTSRNCTVGVKSASCPTVCRCTWSCGRGSAKATGRSPPGSSSNNWKSFGWGGGSPGSSTRSSSRFLPPRSCPSSDLVRCGASSITGPSRRLAVHAARAGVTVALAAFERRQRVHRCRATTT